VALKHWSGEGPRGFVKVCVVCSERLQFELRHVVISEG